MEITGLIPILALVTLLLVVVFAMFSKRKTKERMQSDTKKSRLAEDAPNK